jgi:hypothetical protein
MNGPIFTATFSAISVSAAQDVFELTTHASSRIEICEVVLGQYSDAGDAQAEMLSVQIIRGYTVAGSGGAAVTPGNFEPWSRAALTTVARNNTTLANTGTAVILHAESFNVQGGFLYRPLKNHEDNERLKVEKDGATNGLLVVRITAPSDAVTMNGTIKFRELGLVPG